MTLARWTGRPRPPVGFSVSPGSAAPWSTGRKCYSEIGCIGFISLRYERTANGDVAVVRRVPSPPPPPLPRAFDDKHAPLQHIRAHNGRQCSCSRAHVVRNLLNARGKRTRNKRTSCFDTRFTTTAATTSARVTALTTAAERLR